MDGPDTSDYSALPGVQVTPDQVVAANLRYYRQQARLTLAELGEMLGLSVKNMSAIEVSADPSRPPRRFTAENLLRIAVALGIPVTALLLPPPDDGVNHRYLVSTGAELLDAPSYAAHIDPAPDPDDDRPAAQAYGRRWEALTGSGYGEALAQARAQQVAPGLIERLGRQRAALAEMIADIDEVTGVIAENRHGT